MDKNITMSIAILEAFNDGIYVMNQDLVVEYMNSAMIAQFGDGIGKKCHELINQSDEKCPWCRSDEIFEGKKISREGYVPLVDKTYYLTEIPFENEDGNILKLSVYRDITERKKREEMLRASEEDFRNLFVWRERWYKLKVRNNCQNSIAKSKCNHNSAIHRSNIFT